MDLENYTENQLLELLKENNLDDENKLYIYNQLGNIYYNNKDYSNAEEYFVKLLPILKKDNYGDLKKEVYDKLGNIYSNQISFKEAIKKLSFLFRFLIPTIDNKLGIQIYVRISTIYLEHYASINNPIADYQFKLNEWANCPFIDKKLNFELSHNLARIYEKYCDYKNAISFYFRCLSLDFNNEIIIKHSNIILNTKLYQTIGSVLSNLMLKNFSISDSFYIYFNQKNNIIALTSDKYKASSDDILLLKYEYVNKKNNSLTQIMFNQYFINQIPKIDEAISKDYVVLKKENLSNFYNPALAINADPYLLFNTIEYLEWITNKYLNNSPIIIDNINKDFFISPKITEKECEELLVNEELDKKIKIDLLKIIIKSQKDNHVQFNILKENYKKLLLLTPKVQETKNEYIDLLKTERAKLNLSFIDQHLNLLIEKQDQVDNFNIRHTNLVNLFNSEESRYKIIHEEVYKIMNFNSDNQNKISLCNQIDYLDKYMCLTNSINDLNKKKFKIK